MNIVGLEKRLSDAETLALKLDQVITQEVADLALLQSKGSILIWEWHFADPDIVKDQAQP